MTTNTALAAEIVATAEANASLARSVVSASYKLRYAERALSARGKKGVDKRVVADSNGDWLALELAAMLRPTKKSRLNVELLDELCALNGVSTANLPRNTPNWQGRLRMNAGQMLRTAIAEANGEFITPSGTLHAPRNWVARYAGK